MLIQTKGLQTHPCGLRSSESSMLKLGEPRSGAVLFADVDEAVLMVVVHRLAVPLGQALGGLVTRKLSDSARFFTWCITPKTGRTKTDITNNHLEKNNNTIQSHFLPVRLWKQSVYCGMMRKRYFVKKIKVLYLHSLSQYLLFTVRYLAPKLIAINDIVILFH